MNATLVSKLAAAIQSSDPVSGLTHDFYRYPARFSPIFARTAIQAFTKPNDTVLDPFMGGGTTLVEARSLGRHAIGTDISSLARFIATVKTTALTDHELKRVLRWAPIVVSGLSPVLRGQRHVDWLAAGYQKDVPWRLRKMIEQGLDALQLLPTRQRTFARCAILRTSQWAMDCRDHFPSAEEYRGQFLASVSSMVDGMREFTERAAEHGPASVQVYEKPAESISSIRSDRLQRRAVNLVLTSPPYAGIHVLYHRWQVRGRRETAAPFWIANCLDGHGESHYTFGSRKRPNEIYFQQLCDAFVAIRQVVADDAWIVQLVGFADARHQLPKYLDVMRQAGFSQVEMGERENSELSGSVWRQVPNRKWYAKYRDVVGQASEVLLIHRPSRSSIRHLH